jgi:hypothetical protein
VTVNADRTIEVKRPGVVVGPIAGVKKRVANVPVRIRLDDPVVDVRRPGMIGLVIPIVAAVPVAIEVEVRDVVCVRVAIVSVL